MCGRYVLASSSEDLARHFGVDNVATGELFPRYNVAPSQHVPAVAAEREGAVRRLESFRWGLVPAWAESPAMGNKLINARSETVLSSRAYRDAFEVRRCLIPADGFYEWQRDPGQRRGRSLPWFFRPVSPSPLALGGLWERWRDAEGRWLLSCTVLTTAANALLAPVHDRMPVVIAPADFSLWLAKSPLGADERARLLAPVPEDLLVARRVGAAVSDARNEGPELLEAV